MRRGYRRYLLTTMGYKRIQLLLFLTSLCVVVGNPFTGLLMMNGGDMNSHSKKTKKCISPDVLESLQKKLNSVEDERDLVLADLKASVSQIEQLHSEMNSLRKDTKQRLEQLQSASEAANRLASVQDELNRQMERFKTQTEADMADQKELLKQKEASILSQKEEFKAAIHEERKIADQRVKEAAEHWKVGLSEVDSKSQLQLKKIEANFEARVAEVRAHYEKLLDQQRSAVASLEEEKKSLIQSARNDGINENKKVLAELSVLEKEVRDFRRDSKENLEQILDATDITHRLAELQGQLNEEMERVRSQAAKDLAEADAKLRQKEEKIDAQKKELDNLRKQEREVADKRLRKMEADWKKVLDGIENSSSVYLEKISSEHEAKITNIRSTYEKELEKQQSEVKSLKEEKAALIDSQKDETDRIQQIVNEQRALVTVLEKEKASLEGYKIALNEQFEKLQEKYFTMLNNQEAGLPDFIEDNVAARVRAREEQMVQKLQERTDELHRAHAQRMKDLETAMQHELEAERSRLQEDYDHLQDSLKRQSEEELKEALAQHEQAMEKLRKAQERALDDLNQRLSEAHQSLEVSKQDSSELQDLINQLSAEIERISMDAKYWESSFLRRSYLNITHIQEDAVALAEVAKDISLKKYNETMKSLDVARRSCTAKSKDLYENYARETVDKVTEKALPIYKAHVQPIYESHVQPAVENATAAVTHSLDTVRDSADVTFKELVAEFRKECPKALNTMLSAWTNVGISVPPHIIRNLNRSCKEPETSVTRALQVIIAIFVIIFRGSIWMLFCGIVMSVFRILWYFSPLRLFFGRSQKH